MLGRLSEDYVSAEDVCLLLGVTRQTVYSYVSRGKLRSRTIPGTKERQYWKPDVTRLLNRAPAEVSHGHKASGETSITLITERGPFYRGHLATQLAETATIEAVAALLWEAEPEALFAPTEMVVPPIYSQIAPLLADYGDVDRATALFPLLEKANPRAFDSAPAGMMRTGVEVLRWLAAIVLRRAAPSDTPLHLTFAQALALDPERTDLVRRMLVLAADHGLEPGTIAVRAVASTGVTPWRAVLTGLSVTTGRQTRARHYGEVARFVQSVMASTQPDDIVVRRLQDGEALPGFTSPVYASGDPRGQALLAFCAEIFAGDQEFVRLRKALDAVESITGLRPNFALANMFARHKLGLAGSNTPFVLGRACGWIAHTIEQSHQGELARGVTSYKGALPRP